RLPSYRKLARDTLQVGEDAVATLGMELIDRFLEKPLIVHVRISLCARRCAAGVGYTVVGKGWT
ncbi:hypothetical protein, partial [Mesorhizobium sp. LNHC209A00]|uniref:hypothetical protein n=1 Tax=Mesorhizobium sp. LNHC209A00 TaxID=1287226 RepID=UPI001AEC493F